jgi:hypothetical protein
MNAVCELSLEIGLSYTRQQISDLLGGSVRAYLPFTGGKVVCGCFDPSDAMNPNAPEEVLFGEPHEAPVVSETARMVFRQGQEGTAIPVFLKRTSNQWDYVGEYLCIGITFDPRVVKRKMKENPRRRPFSGVLRFEKV